jgi:hypothetical protein
MHRLRHSRSIGKWSDPAIARTTPALLGLFSLIALWANELHAARQLTPSTARWYCKALPTFSDAIAAVRRELWKRQDFSTSASNVNIVKMPRTTINALINAASYAA